MPKPIKIKPVDFWNAFWNLELFIHFLRNQLEKQEKETTIQRVRLR